MLTYQATVQSKRAQALAHDAPMGLGVVGASTIMLGDAGDAVVPCALNLALIADTAKVVWDALELSAAHLIENFEVEMVVGGEPGPQ